VAATPEILAAVEDVCRAGETNAATRSEPTSAAHEVLRACRDDGRPIVIVTNNAAEAIEGPSDRNAIRISCKRSWRDRQDDPI